MSIKLYDEATNRFLGTISEEQLGFLIDFLEEEFSEDTDYYIDHETIDFLDENTNQKDLIELLRKSLGTDEGIEIIYHRE